MSLVRFSSDSSDPRFGIRGNGAIVPLEHIIDEGAQGETGDWLGELVQLESKAEDYLAQSSSSGTVSTDEVTLHRPLDPGKVIRIEGSYDHHVTDGDYNPFLDPEQLAAMSWPRLWTSPQSSMVGPNGTVNLPGFAQTVRPGVELGFMVGSEAKYLDEEEAMDAIAGYMVAIDVGIFDPLPGQWGYKFFDTALPIGDAVVPLAPDRVNELELSIRLNGTEVDSNNTENWRFRAEELVSSVSEMMTLRPGDLILTGDPLRSDEQLEAGDELVGVVESVGAARADVTRDQTPAGMRI